MVPGLVCEQVHGELRLLGVSMPSVSALTFLPVPPLAPTQTIRKATRLAYHGPDVLQTAILCPATQLLGWKSHVHFTDTRTEASRADERPSRATTGPLTAKPAQARVRPCAQAFVRETRGSFSPSPPCAGTARPQPTPPPPGPTEARLSLGVQWVCRVQLPGSGVGACRSVGPVCVVAVRVADRPTSLWWPWEEVSVGCSCVWRRGRGTCSLLPEGLPG